MKKEDGKQFRDTLRVIISDSYETEPVALLFSGGTDSLTILWTLLDMGVVPTECVSITKAETGGGRTHSRNTRWICHASQSWLPEWAGTRSDIGTS